MGLPAPVAGPNGSRRLPAVLSVALFALALLSLIGPASLPGNPAGSVPAPRVVPRAPDPGLALLAARSAISEGLGPAAGRAVDCTATAPSAVQCQERPFGLPNRTSSGASWTNLSGVEPSAPPARVLGNMVWDGRDGYVLWFGGCSVGTCNSAPYGDTWVFQHAAWRQISPGVSPPARAIAQMAYDPIDHEVVLFGGLGAALPLQIFNDTWTFSNGTWSNLSPVHSPSPRYRGMMAYDALDGYVVLFGGTPDNSATTVPFSQTWEFVNQKWTDLTSKVSGSPTARFRGAMAYDAVDGYLVLFGGCTSLSRCPTKDTWTYSNLTWKNLTGILPSAPSPRVYPGMTYDVREGCVLLFGGNQTTAFNSVAYRDSWIFQGGKWINETQNLTYAPSARGESELSADLSDNLTVMFGGYGRIGLLSETYSFGPFVVLGSVVAPAKVDVNETTVFTSVAAAANGSAITFSYAGLPNGCASANLARLTCAPGANGTFEVNVTANDPTGDTAMASTNLTVAPDPAITSFTVTPSTVTRGSPVNFSVSASRGIPPYHYTYHNLPAGCLGPDAASFTCRPGAAAPAKTYTVEAQLSDAASFQRFSNVTLTVNAQPSISGFTAVPPLIDRGQSTTLTVAPAGGTAPLTYVYTGLPIGCTSQNLSQLPCRPSGPAGSSNVTVNVTDAFGWYATANLTLRVHPALGVASFWLSAATIDRGVTFTVALNATGGTAPYSYNYTLPSGCASVNLSLVTCRAVSTGTFSAYGQAKDLAGEVVSHWYNVTVVPPPSVSAFTVTPSEVDVGYPANFTVAVSGGTTPYHYAFQGLPVGCLSVDEPTLPCAPLTASTASVEVTATDAWGLRAFANVTVVVHRAPAISAFTVSAPAASVGTTIYLNVTASGGTGALTYAYAGLPEGCAPANVSSLACAPSHSGSFTVTVTVTDAEGLGGSARVSFQVTPAAPKSANGGGAGIPLIDLAIAGLLGAAVLVAAVVLLRRRQRPPVEEPADGPPEAPEPAAEGPAPWEEGPGP